MITLRTVLGPLCLIAAAAGCVQPSAVGGPPSVILISIDTLRADHLGSYGYGRDTSPHIDGLAKRGVVFENTRSTASWTLPAHVSLFTGLYPAEHGIQDDAGRLDERLPVLAEGFRSRGYHTLGVVSHLYVSRAFGLERGFQIFDDSLIEGGSRNPVAEEVVDLALHHFDELPPGPFFAFLHFFDPHWSYEPPPPYDTRFADPDYAGSVDGTVPSLAPYLRSGGQMPEADRAHMIALYDGEIAYLDSQLGRLLDGLEERGRLHHTLVVITADHGEEFKEHGALGHGETLYEEQLCVPLIIAGHPSMSPGTRRSDHVSLVDLAPTLLGVTGSDAAMGSGVSLLDRQSLSGRVVFAEAIRPRREIGLRSAIIDRFKLIHRFEDDHRRFYDLDADARELRPSAEDPSGGKLLGALAEYASRVDRGWHLTLVAQPPHAITYEATVSTRGHIVRPRRYLSGDAFGSGKASFSRFALDPSAARLRLRAEVVGATADVVFETDPPDVPVTFDVQLLEGPTAAVGFLGRDVEILGSEPVTLGPSDRRLVGSQGGAANRRSGYHLRFVAAAATPGPQLSEAAIERLRALGYADPGPAERSGTR